MYIMSLHNETDIARKEGLDKFYTVPDVALSCIEIIGAHYSWDKWDLIIEPSAGSGSFLLQIPRADEPRYRQSIIGLDIAPEHNDIIKQDFFTYMPPPECKQILVLGNPPFGRVCSTAIKFFNHAATFAETIAFIIPRTFRRISVQNKLDRRFHLIYDKEISMRPCAFEPPLMAKCCFQIWQKQPELRSIISLAKSHPDWIFLEFGPLDDKHQPTPPKNADFALRAYGGKCGEIVERNLDKLRPKSWHWIKSNIDKKKLISRFQQIDYSLSKDTARQNSIGRGELVQAYCGIINQPQ